MTAENAEALYVVLAPCKQDDGPYEDFIEVETADGHGRSVPSAVAANGWRRIGPLYAAPPAVDAEHARTGRLAAWVRSNALSWHTWNHGGDFVACGEGLCPSARALLDGDGT